METLVVFFTESLVAARIHNSYQAVLFQWCDLFVVWLIDSPQRLNNNSCLCNWSSSQCPQSTVGSEVGFVALSMQTRNHYQPPHPRDTQLGPCRTRRFKPWKCWGNLWGTSDYVWTVSSRKGFTDWVQRAMETCTAVTHPPPPWWEPTTNWRLWTN